MSTLRNGATVTVTDAATQLLPANGRRRGLILTNAGSTEARIGTEGVTVPTGFVLAAGATVTFGWDEVPTNAVYGICPAAASTTVIASEVVQ